MPVTATIALLILCVQSLERIAWGCLTLLFRSGCFPLLYILSNLQKVFKSSIKDWGYFVIYIQTHPLLLFCPLFFLSIYFVQFFPGSSEGKLKA